MKIYSEITKKEYQTVDECLKDEAVFMEEKAKKDEEKNQLAKQRKEDAKKVEDAYKAIIEANKNYNKLRDEFIKKYGSFHMTVTNRGSEIPFDFFDMFFNW